MRLRSLLLPVCSRIPLATNCELASKTFKRILCFRPWYRLMSAEGMGSTARCNAEEVDSWLLHLLLVWTVNLPPDQ